MKHYPSALLEGGESVDITVQVSKEYLEFKILHSKNTDGSINEWPRLSISHHDNVREINGRNVPPMHSFVHATCEPVQQQKQQVNLTSHFPAEQM